MKVLFLSKEYPPHIYGGAGVHVDYLSRELAKLMDVEVRCFGEQDESRPHLRVRGFDSDAGAFGCPKPLQPALDAARRCIDFNAAGIDADLVHCHTWYTHLAGITARLCYGVPLVITVHSLEPLRPWKREQLAGGYDFSSWVEKTALETADAVIAVSGETRRDILKLFSVPEERLRIIHNGIDTSEYRPQPSKHALARFGIDPEAPFLLFVGRITRQKGIVHLVEAIRYLDPGFQVVLCAGAPDTPEIGAEMTRLVNQAAAARPGVIWIQQMVDKESVIQLYSHAAVFCCPSVYEPFGLINLEAMACETAVVASAVGGIPEVVVEGETGFLVPLEQSPEPPFLPVDGDRFARDLSDRINRLMADESMRRRFGVAGRKRAEAHFSWSAVARQTQSLYQELSGTRAQQAR